MVQTSLYIYFGANSLFFILPGFINCNRYKPLFYFWPTTEGEIMIRGFKIATTISYINLFFSINPFAQNNQFLAVKYRWKSSEFSGSRYITGQIYEP